jgi:uncharacterized protein with HEPN domain
MSERDISVLNKIIGYTDEINDAIIRYNINYDLFATDKFIRSAITMFVLQIGELASNLTDDFKSNHSGMPWRDIIALRNRAAHAYESMDVEMLWKTVTDKIPELKQYCEKILNNN